MRTLAIASLGFSAAVFLANYLLPARWLPYAAAVTVLLCAAFALTGRKRLRPAAIALLFFAVGLAEYGVYCRLTLDRARECAGQTREYRAAVLDYPELYDDYARLRVRLTSEDAPRFKAIVYDGGKGLAAAQPGDTVTFTARTDTADTIYGKPYDAYRVSGFFLRLSVVGDGELQKGGFSLRTLPVRARHFLCSRAEAVFPEDTRAFVKALMLGDKQNFYADDALYVTMSRAGLMHVAAVSGLHISFLIGLLVFFFARGRFGAVCGGVLIWCFVLVTGCSSSAVRAAFMQSLLLPAPFLRREYDPLTALSCALALLLAACPFAAKSVSLQMSFAAMAGIVCFADKLLEALLRPIPPRRRAGLPRSVLGMLAGTLSVMVFTLPLTALHFGYVTLLAAVSNIACLWAVSACFCLAWLACLLSLVPPLGAAAGWLCGWLVRYILFAAGLVARLPCAVLYVKTGGALAWMLVSYALVLLGLRLRARRALRVLLPTGLSLALLAGLVLHTGRHYRADDYVTVLDVGQGQCVTAFAGDVTAVIDCGNVASLENAGAIAGEYLLSCGRKRVELLILTHLHRDHADGVVRLMELLPVDTLILPPVAGENGLREAILACAARHGTRVETVGGNAAASCGGLHAKIYRCPGESDNDRGLMVGLRVGKGNLLVTGDAAKAAERKLAAEAALEDTDILVVGRHGAKDASDEAFLRELGGGLALVSAGDGRYGQLAPETLQTLAAYGFTVKRTDRDGTLETRLEREYG